MGCSSGVGTTCRVAVTLRQFLLRIECSVVWTLSFRILHCSNGTNIMFQCRYSEVRKKLSRISRATGYACQTTQDTIRRKQVSTRRGCIALCASSPIFSQSDYAASRPNHRRRRQFPEREYRDSREGKAREEEEGKFNEAVEGRSL